MIKIAIQDSGIRTEYTEKMVNACIKLNLPYECFGIIPFSHELTGAILDDKSSTIIPFGSTDIIKLYHEGKLPANWKIWHNKNRFSLPEIAKQPFMKYLLLNLRHAFIADFPQCVNDKYSVDYFIRPADDLKLFDGQILPAFTSIQEHFATKTGNDRFWLANEKIIFAEPREIIDEYRIFVVNGIPVTKAKYKVEGKLTSGFSYKFNWLETFMINNLATVYKPAWAYVVDICTTEGLFGKNWHILEYNALQASGLYTCDAEQLLHAINYYWKDNESTIT